MSKRLGRRAFVGGAVSVVVTTGLEPVRAARPAGLPPAERRRLRAAVDTIIPAEGRMPSASAAGGVAYLEGLASRDPAFRALLLDGLRALDARAKEAGPRGFAESGAAQQAHILGEAEKADAPAGFVAALRDAVYEAYYSNPEVWKLIGYRFRSGPRPTAPLEPFDERRVARVRAMGRLYRETD